MPVTSYFEIDAPRHVRLTTDASDHTRYVKMMAQVAPYINSTKTVGAPTLGWKSNEISAQARLIAPLYGKLNSFIPNRK
jgi:hypothetical protein